MKDCGDYCGAIRLYLDNELHSPRITELCAHLEQCPACRRKLEAEEKLSRLLRRAQPLYSAPDSLKNRIQQIASEACPDFSPGLPPNKDR
jgi:mycothiol system anti-sigma-R factor